MAETKILKTIIKLRRDTAANWATSTYVPQAGEPCVELDTGRMKIGDGVKTFANLPYSGGVDEQVFQVVATAEQTDAEAISGIVGENPLQAGDVCIVKRLIAGSAYSYTAYVYKDSTNGWVAMDGNYDAENVYFDSDLSFTENIGVKKIDATGSGTIAAEGKNLKQVLQSILAQEKYPTVAQPAASIQLKNNTTNVNADTAVEYGTSVTPAYSTSLSAGSYTYGPATGITATGYSVQLKNGTTNVGDAKTTASGTFDAVTISSGDSYTIVSTISHGAGSTPVTNMGNDATKDIEDCEGSKVSAIAAGNKSVTSKKFTGYKMGRFYGTLTSVVPASEVTSAQVRTLTKNNASTTTGTFEFDVPVGAKTIVIAIADTQAGARSLKQVLNTTVNADMTTSFAKEAGVVVAGADGSTTSGNQGYYTVWTYSPAEAYGSTAHLKVTIQ